MEVDQNFWLRAVHMAAIACALESWLRQRAGQTSYAGAFLGPWAHTLIFYNLPAQVFTVCISRVAPW